MTGDWAMVDRRAGWVLIVVLALTAVTVLWVAYPGASNRDGTAPSTFEEQQTPQNPLATGPALRESANRSGVITEQEPALAASEAQTDMMLAWVGRVRDSVRAPIADAKVEVSVNAHSVSALSDESGAWAVSLGLNATLTSIQEQTADLVVTKRGYEASGSRVLCDPSRVVHVPTTVLLRGGSISGRVVDQDGWPIASARVSALKVGRGGYARQVLLDNPHLIIEDTALAIVHTDDEGAFEFYGLPLGSVDLWVQAARYEPRLRIDEAAGAMMSEHVEITLNQVPGERCISGRIVDSSGSAPQYMTVEAAKSESASLVWDTRTWLSQDGSFCLELAEAVPHDIRVVDPWAPRTLASIQYVASGTEDLILSIPSGPVVRVSVADTNGSPIANVVLDLVLPRGGSNLRVSQVETTSDGSGTLPMISDEPFLIMARAHGFRPARSGPHAPDSADMHISFILEAGPALRGVVLDESGPAPGATIELLAAVPPDRRAFSVQPVLAGTAFDVRIYPKASAAVQSDQDGRFVVMVPRAREYVLQARRAEKQSARLVLGHLLPESDLSDLTLRLESPGIVRCQLLLPDNLPGLVGQIVAVSDGSGVIRAQAIGPEAEYSFQLPPGDWQIRACPSGLASMTTTRARPARDEDPAVSEWDFHIESGRLTQVDVDLRNAGTCSVVGSLTWGDASMNGWRAALLDVRTRTMPITLGREVATLSSVGEFSLRASQPGSYLLRIWNSRVDVLQTITLGVGERTWSYAVQTAQLRIQGIPPLTANSRKYAVGWSGSNGLQVFLLAEASDQEDRVQIEVPAGTLSILSTEGTFERGFFDEGWREDAVLTVDPGEITEVLLDD